MFSSEGETAARESYRQALFSVAAPLGRLVQSELRRKLETDDIATWQELRAADIASRARAFSSLVKGGMALDQAATVSGVLMESDG